MAKKTLVPIADGSEEIEAVTIIDVLRRAGVDVTVASVAHLQVRASRGVKIASDVSIVGCVGKEYDLVVLPGGMPGAEHLRDSKELVEILRKQADSGRLYAAVCASPAVVLAHHGLLEGKKATCYPGMEDKLGDSAVDERVVVDGNCITSQGPGTAMEFAVKLVEALLGPEKAKEIADGLLLNC